MANEKSERIITQAAESLAREFAQAKEYMELSWKRTVQGIRSERPSNGSYGQGVQGNKALFQLGRRHVEFGNPLGTAVAWVRPFLKKLHRTTLRDERRKIEENRRNISQTFFHDIQEAEEERLKLIAKRAELEEERARYSFKPKWSFWGSCLFAGLLLSAEFGLAEQVTRYSLGIDPPWDWVLAFALVSMAYLFKHLADLIAEPEAFMKPRRERRVPLHEILCVTAYGGILFLTVTLIYSMTQLRSAEIIKLLSFGEAEISEPISVENVFAQPAEADLENSEDISLDPAAKLFYLKLFFGSAALLFPILGGMIFSRAKRSYGRFLQADGDLAACRERLAELAEMIARYRQNLGQALFEMRCSLRITGASSADLTRFLTGVSWLTLSEGSKDASVQEALSHAIDEPSSKAIRRFVQAVSSHILETGGSSALAEMVSLYLDFLMVVGTLLEGTEESLEEIIEELAVSAEKEIEAGGAGLLAGPAMLEGFRTDSLMNLVDLKEFHRRLTQN